MSQESQEKPGGNTKNARPVYQLFRWTATIKKEIWPDPMDLWHVMSQEAKEFYFQLEKGEQEGYLHYQLCFSLINKEYFATVKNLIGDATHLEAVKDWRACIKYCTKEETRVSGPWTHLRKPLKLITVLRPWQSDLVKELKQEPDDRTLVWYSNPPGGAGKTVFAKWLVWHMGAIVLTNGGTADIAIAIGEDPKIVIFNFARSREGYISYEALEGVKDGLITSKKYKSTTKIFNPPHVVIFANWEPNVEELTKERWDIRKMY